MNSAREEAAANAEDAALWRWFSDLYDEGLIRWFKTDDGWLVSASHRHVATTLTFDEGIREAKARVTKIDLSVVKKRAKRRKKTLSAVMRTEHFTYNTASRPDTTVFSLTSSGELITPKKMWLHRSTNQMSALPFVSTCTNLLMQILVARQTVVPAEGRDIAVVTIGTFRTPSR